MAVKSRKPVRKKKTTPDQQLQRSVKQFKRLGPMPGDSEDWSDRAKRSIVANEILGFGSETAGQSEEAMDNYGPPLRAAFREFGLNPDNPHNWRALLKIFAAIHFGPTDTERKYLAYALKVHSLASQKKESAVQDTALHFKIAEGTVWNALRWAEKFELFRVPGGTKKDA
jgi:hypothetical protein